MSPSTPKRTTAAAAVLLATLAVSLLVPAGAGAQEGPEGDEGAAIDVLVYSATYGFRHASIDTANARFAELGDSSDEFEVDLTTDPSRISREGLAPYDVLLFLNATGEHPFSDEQRRAMLDWIDAGNGFVATHASADGNYHWSEFGDLLGAYFLAHPHTGVATNDIEDPDHPLVAHLPERYELEEEYYRFQLDPRPNVHVLTSLDRSTAGQTGQTYVEAQPTTWCQEYGGGRSFYTSWGHFDASFENPDVWHMLLQGIRWADGRFDADCTPTEPVPEGRLQAEDADQIAFGHKETSTEEGAEQVVTEILNQGHLLFRDVDLTGVDQLRVHLSVETAPEPEPYHIPQATPAWGGTIHVRLGGVNDGQADPDGGCPFAGQCTPAEDVATIEVAQDAPGWKTLSADLSDVEGRHDLTLVFTEQLSEDLAGTRIFVPELTNERYLFSVDWVELAASEAPAPEPGTDTTGFGETLLTSPAGLAAGVAGSPLAGGGLLVGLLLGVAAGLHLRRR